MSRSLLSIPFALAAVCFTGCGPTYHPTKCVVKMGGEVVGGATVTFVSTDNRNYFGTTDASGIVELGDGTKKGVLPGSYKVLITKVPPLAMSEGTKSDSKEYIEQMKKSMKSSGPPGKGGPPGVGAGKGPESSKNELPKVYSSVSTTTISVTVPVTTTPHPIDLEGEKKK
jgi:hypothetical protein